MRRRQDAAESESVFREDAGRNPPLGLFRVIIQRLLASMW
jgi:hypothetical protein